MPRKATAKSTEAGVDVSQPRRSSRIKEMPKPEPVKKQTKPRQKKAAKEIVDGVEEKTKGSKGRKRKATAEDEDNGEAQGDAEQPAAKKTKPDSKAKPTSKAKPSSKPASAAAKPASKASAKPASRAPSTKPASRGGSRKPHSKVGGGDTSVAIGETIAEEPEPIEA